MSQQPLLSQNSEFQQIDRILASTTEANKYLTVVASKIEMLNESVVGKQMQIKDDITMDWSFL